MKILLFALLGAWWPENQIVSLTTSCESLKLSADTKSIANGEGEILLTAEGGSSPYKYIIFKSSGHLLSEDFSQKKFQHLKADTYQAIVLDDKGCKKQIEIKLQ